jgi:hypothetical protein
MAKTYSERDLVTVDDLKALPTSPLRSSHEKAVHAITSRRRIYTNLPACLSTRS